MTAVSKKQIIKNKIFSCHDPLFQPYGRILEGYDFSGYVEYASEFENPSEGVEYKPGIPAMESLSVTKKIENSVFGELPVQVGWCRGRNSILGAFEYHKSSEVVVAVTDCILILGQTKDICENFYDTADARIFYLKQGEGVELFSTTLHFAPAETGEGGFCSIIILPQGTNSDLTYSEIFSGTGEERLLFARNKWLLAYPESKQSARGAFPGLRGEIIRIISPVEDNF